MKLWQIFVATLLCVVLASALAGAAWRSVFDTGMPSYLAGMIGGIAAVVVWSFLRKRRRGKADEG